MQEARKNKIISSWDYSRARACLIALALFVLCAQGCMNTKLALETDVVYLEEFNETIETKRSFFALWGLINLSGKREVRCNRGNIEIEEKTTAIDFLVSIFTGGVIQSRTTKIRCK